jgi:Methane oxygenase PmoA
MRLAPNLAVGLAAAVALAGAPPETIHVTLDPGAHARARTPVTLVLLCPDSLRGVTLVAAELDDEHGVRIDRPVQVAAESDQLTVFWVEPALAAGAPQQRTLRLKPARQPSQIELADGFHFSNGPDWRQLRYIDQPIWRRVFAYEPAHLDDTLRPYLHLFGFHEEGFVTKGLGGLYPHQRGLFLGWERTGFGGKTYDFWSCNGVVQRQAGFLRDREMEGPVVARDSAMTEWLTRDNQVVLRDSREYATWHTLGMEFVLDVTVTLEAPNGPVTLDGDANHGGLQFRASNEVRGRAIETSFLRSRDGKRLRGDAWAGLDWATMIFHIGSHAYAVSDLSFPDNPGPTLFATRDYGRIGTFFAGSVQPGKPLVFRNRFLFQEAAARSDVTAASQATRYWDVASPVAISIR